MLLQGAKAGGGQVYGLEVGVHLGTGPGVSRQVAPYRRDLREVAPYRRDLREMAHGSRT